MKNKICHILHRTCLPGCGAPFNPIPLLSIPSLLWALGDHAALSGKHTRSMNWPVLTKCRCHQNKETYAPFGAAHPPWLKWTTQQIVFSLLGTGFGSQFIAELSGVLCFVYVSFHPPRPGMPISNPLSFLPLSPFTSFLAWTKSHKWGLRLLAFLGLLSPSLCYFLRFLCSESICSLILLVKCNCYSKNKIKTLHVTLLPFSPCLSSLNQCTLMGHHWSSRGIEGSRQQILIFSYIVV